MKNSFYLVTPEQQDDKELLAFYEKEAVSSWLSSLPTTSPGIAIRSLRDFIKKFNATKMPAQQRLETAELLRPHFLKLKQSFYPLLNRFGFPKSEHDQKIFSLLISLEKNFTIAYWLVTSEITHRRVNWAQGKNAALAVQRTIKGLSGIVISYHSMYLPVPDWIWLDLHSLYKLSLKIKKESTKVPNGSGSFVRSVSPEEAYIQVLLFSIVQPNRLMQKEIGQIYNLINTVSRFTKISKEPIKDQLIQCVISIDEDRKPFLTQSCSARNVPTFFLNFSQLYKVLNQSDKLSNSQQSRFETLKFAEKAPKKISLELLEYTTNQWKHISKNNPPLFSDRLDRYITVGLTSTYLFQTSTDENKKREAHAKSFSEYELVSSSLTEGLISVGSLVGYKQAKPPKGELHLGIVKKITIPRLRGDVIFELSLLSKQAYAASYLDKDANLKDKPQKALLYRKKIDLKYKTYILIEFYTYKNGDVIHLFFNDNNFNVVLGDKKCVGLGYSQFECRRVENKPSQQKQHKQRKANLIINYLFKAK